MKSLFEFFKFVFDLPFNFIKIYSWVVALDNAVYSCPFEDAGWVKYISTVIDSFFNVIVTKESTSSL